MTFHRAQWARVAALALTFAGCTSIDDVALPSVREPFADATLGAVGYRRRDVTLTGRAGDETVVAVYGPADPAHFNGTLLVERVDALPAGSDRLGGHRDLTRNGFAWAGVATTRDDADAFANVAWAIGRASAFVPKRVLAIAVVDQAAGPRLDDGDVPVLHVDRDEATALLRTLAVMPIGMPLFRLWEIGAVTHR
jgi:hypothetical protein